MACHSPSQELLGEAALAEVQRAKLAGLFSSICASNEFYRRKFADVAPEGLRGDLAALPFTTRAELEQDQADAPPKWKENPY